MAKETEPVSDTGVPTNDAYTGMLAIALIALIAGSILLLLDYSQYSGTPTVTKLPPVQSVAPKVEGPAPAPKDGADKGAPMPMPMPMPMPEMK